MTAAPAWFMKLIRAATDEDAQPPFSDQSLVDLDSGERTLVGVEGIAAAVHSDTELELVVAPASRRQGHGTALTRKVLDDQPGLRLAWAHGDHPASRILADRFGFEPVRTLLQLRAPLTSVFSTGRPARDAPQKIRTETTAQGRTDRPHARTVVHIRSFRPGTDDAAWLDLNARAFADHPEQGAFSQRDLDARKTEPWFDADSFLLLFDGDELVGSNWLKIDPANPALGEIYAIAVAPDHQGKGHSRLLMDAGLARLRERQVTTVSLYVEADNTAALALYESYGFVRHTIDVQYARA